VVSGDWMWRCNGVGVVVGNMEEVQDEHVECGLLLIKRGVAFAMLSHADHWAYHLGGTRCVLEGFFVWVIVLVVWVMLMVLVMVLVVLVMVLVVSVMELVVWVMVLVMVLVDWVMVIEGLDHWKLLESFAVNLLEVLHFEFL